MSDDAGERLNEVLRHGTRAALERWALTGSDGVALTRAFLGRSWTATRLEGVHERDVLDRFAAAIAVIAEAEPAAFLDEFADERFRGDSFVLDGLGRIDDDRATARLAAAAMATDWSTRMHAAIGLGRRPSPVASRALRRLLTDPEALVRHHAIESLRRIGVPADVPFLEALAPDVAAAILSRSPEREASG